MKKLPLTTDLNIGKLMILPRPPRTSVPYSVDREGLFSGRSFPEREVFCDPTVMCQSRLRSGPEGMGVRV